MNKKSKLFLMLTLLSGILFSCGNYSDYDPYYYDEDIEEVEETEYVQNTNERKIVYTVRLHLLCDDVDEAISKFSDAVVSFSGRTENCDVTYSDGKATYAIYKFKVPTDKLDEFLNQQEEEFTVSGKNITSEDITSTYNATLARIEVLKAQRQVYQDELDNNKDLTTADKIAIIDKINEIDVELDTLEKQKASYDGILDYSTIYTYFHLQSTYVEPSFFSEYFEVIGTIFVFIGKAILYLLPFAIIATGLFFLINFFVTRHQRKEKEKLEENKKE